MLFKNIAEVAGAMKATGCVKTKSLVNNVFLFAQSTSAAKTVRYKSRETNISAFFTLPYFNKSAFAFS